jgi:MFS transporter, FHS family, L-fucose permease
MGGRSRFMVGLIFAIFFVISFLTNILGPLVPDIISGFKVSLGTAALLPFSFFIAYGVMSIPAGFLVERWGEKRLMIAAFLLGTAGALSFALFPSFPIAASSLFVMGGGMAALQVAINPLLRVAGGEEHFAFNSAFAQLVFGSASFVSPYVYSYLVTHLAGHPLQQGGAFGILASVTPAGFAWVSIYWLFAIATAVMGIFIATIRMPQVVRNAEESAGTPAMYAALLRNPLTWSYFLCVVAYVGSEQGTADWMSQFLYRYHGIDPHVAGAAAVSWFWGLLTVGCLAGMLLLKLFDSRRVLVGFSLGALAMLTVALCAPAPVSAIAFPCVGLFASIMWPTLVSLALNSMPTHHGPFAGILCTGIMGGAIVPLLIGQLADAYGLRAGMVLLYLTFGYVLSVGFWARPLVHNALLGGRETSDRSANRARQPSRAAKGIER